MPFIILILQMRKLRFIEVKNLLHFFDWSVIALQCVLVSAVHHHESAISKHIYPLPIEPPSYPPQSSRSSQSRELSSLSMQQPPTSYFTQGGLLHISATPLIHPTLSCPLHVLWSVLFRDISIPVLQRVSSEIKK